MEQTQAKLEALGGGALMTTPLWAIVIQDVSLIGSAIASVCGAIIGVHAVWRLYLRAK